MKSSTRTAIAGLLNAAGAALSALATEFGESTETPEPAPTRTRKPRGGNSTTPPPTPEPEAETPAPDPEPEAEKPGKTYEELRALIEPFVKEGRGEEVKKVISKYSAGGLKTMEAKHHAAFEKDLAALSY